MMLMPKRVFSFFLSPLFLFTSPFFSSRMLRQKLRSQGIRIRPRRRGAGSHPVEPAGTSADCTTAAFLQRADRRRCTGTWRTDTRSIQEKENRLKKDKKKSCIEKCRKDDTLATVTHYTPHSILDRLLFKAALWFALSALTDIYHPLRKLNLSIKRFNPCRTITLPVYICYTLQTAWQ